MNKKIVHDALVLFAFTVVKSATTADNEIESISGATITSKAMANGVNACIAYFQNVLGGAN